MEQLSSYLTIIIFEESLNSITCLIELSSSSYNFLFLSWTISHTNMLYNNIERYIRSKFWAHLTILLYICYFGVAIWHSRAFKTSKTSGFCVITCKRFVWKKAYLWNRWIDELQTRAWLLSIIKIVDWEIESYRKILQTEDETKLFCAVSIFINILHQRTEASHVVAMLW